MTLRLGYETITVIHASLVTSTVDGSKARDWPNATRTDYSGCAVQPFLMSNKLIVEENRSREFTAEYLRMWFPKDAVIDYVDRFEWRGTSMEAFGEAQPWYHRGSIHHIQVIGLIRRG